jgi:hypothetical protein
MNCNGLSEAHLEFKKFRGLFVNGVRMVPESESFPRWLAQKILDYHTIPGGEYRHKYGTHGTSIIDDLRRELER